MLLSFPKSRKSPVQRNKGVNAGDEETPLSTGLVHYVSMLIQGEEPQSFIYNYFLILAFHSGS